MPPDLARIPPADVRKALRREVGFGCPVPRCRSTFLEYHHFDPEWHVEQHHRPEGLIPLCPNHHAQAEAFTADQLRQFKQVARNRPATGRFEYLRCDLIGAVGGCLYHETPVLVRDGFANTDVIWFSRDELGHALLNVRMGTTSDEDRMWIQDNDFMVRGIPIDFETPPSGRLLRVRYENGDYMRVEYRTIKSFEAACRKFAHVPPAYIARIIQTWPATFVLVSMKIAGTPIQFGPTMFRLGRFTGRGNVVSGCRVGLSY